ncbi:hypothetical protein EWM64_g8804 [Hericium alpestre]|uniref:Uncharacterized protein n=1 Tax=Hericium alpestre TaxID=135208 RepID=A0A4Y9ZM92_9AGAM|nr:hypothetical protein EWM64_g8804 [Hericium alpestre]
MTWTLGFELKHLVNKPEMRIIDMRNASRRIEAVLRREVHWIQCEGRDGTIVIVAYFCEWGKTDPPVLGDMGGPTDEEIEPLRAELGIREMWYWKTNGARSRPPRPAVYAGASMREEPVDETVQEEMKRIRIEEEREDGHMSDSKAGPS